MQSRVALTELLGPLPGFRGRRVRHRVGGRQLRPASAVGADPGEVLMPARDKTGWPSAAPRWPRTGSSTPPSGSSPQRDPASDRHERNRQGRRLFPRDAVPVLREPRGAAHRVRAPRDPPARAGRSLQLIDSIEDPRERLIASIIATLRMVRESPALAAWFGVHPAADRRRVGRTVRGDRRAGRRRSSIRWVPTTPPSSNAAPAGWCG